MKRQGTFLTGVLGGVGIFYLAAWLLGLPASLRPPSDEQKMMKVEMAGEIVRHYLAYYDDWGKQPKDWGKPLYLTKDMLDTLFSSTPNYPAVESEFHVLDTTWSSIMLNHPAVESNIPRDVYDWRPSPEEDSGAYSNIRLWLAEPAAAGTQSNPAHPQFWIALQCDKEVKIWVDGQDWMSPQALAAKLNEQSEEAGGDQTRAAFLHEQIQYLNGLADHS